MIRATLPPPAAADARLAESARALESMLLRQLVTASGVFKGGEGAGSSVRAGQFAEALSDAVARAGGLGLAAEITRSLGGAAPAPVPRPASAPRDGAAATLPLAPVSGPVTSAFGVRADPFTGEAALHHGVDVGAPEGTPIRAPAAGVVVRAGPRGGYGNAVELDHGNGLVTIYGHASQIAVREGEAVAAGQELGKVGHTGRATGDHLHFEVRRAGRPVDPARALKLYATRAEDTHGSGP